MQIISRNTAYEQVLLKYPDAKSVTMADYFDYWAYPQVFGRTSGPFGGIGGQAMTTFTIEVWTDMQYSVYFCGDKILKVTDNWNGPQVERL